MYEIPQSVNIEGIEYRIRNKGDYRMVLDCFNALNDYELSGDERLYASLIIFYEDMSDLIDLDKLPNIEVAAKEMFKFFNCGEEESPGVKVNHKLIDWQKDSTLISSAINHVAGKEIRAEPYIHWWTFMGYYLAIGESPLSMVVGIRSKIARGRKLEKHELQFRKDNPQYFNLDSRTVAQREQEELVRQLWNSGK